MWPVACRRKRASPRCRAGCAVGARLPRVDGWPKVAGTDRFGADEAPADALWMRVVRSPHARARFTLGDLDAVKARTPGLVAILTREGCAGRELLRHLPQDEGPAGAGAGPRALPRRGGAGAGRHARRGRRHLGCRPADRLDSRTPASSGIEAALAPAAPAIHASVPDNVLTRGNLQVRRRRGRPCGGGRDGGGPLRDALSSSTPTSSRRPALPCPSAPVRSAPTASRSPPARRRPTWTSRRRRACWASSPARVRIRPTACGGGFGGKLDVSVQPLLAVAAWVTRRPVRIVYTRTESMASTTKRHPARIWAKVSADAHGRLTAFEMQADFNTGAYASWGPTVANRVPVHGMGPYKVPNVWNRTRAVYTNDTPAGAFRGFGVPQAAIATRDADGRSGRAAGARSLGHPPHQCARPRRRHALGPGAHALRRPAEVPRCAEGRLGRGARACRDAQREAPAAPARRRHRLHVVRLRQHLAAEPLDHAHHARPRRHAHLLQRRGRHRPGLVHGAAADRGRRAGPAAQAPSAWSSATPT